MNNISIENLTLISLALFFYNFSIFSLVKKLFGRKDFGVIPRSFLSICNSLLFLCLVRDDSNVLLLYIFLFFVFSVEFFWISNGNFFDVLFVVNAVMINIMTAHSVTLCIYAWCSDFSFYYIMHTPEHYFYSLLISILVLTVLTNLVSKVFVLEQMVELIANKVQKKFLFIWFIVINIYFLYNAQIYSIHSVTGFSVINQLFASLSFLFSFFYMIVYTLKNCQIIALTEKTVYYKTELVNQQKIVNNFTQNASFQFNLNLTQDKVISGFGYHEFLLLDNDYNCTRTFDDIARQLVHPEYQQCFLDMLSVENLLAKFAQGISVQSFDFLQKNRVDEESYHWFRGTLSMIRDTLSGDIKVIAYADNIDEEKKFHSDLAMKAQKDSLSGLNNKEHTKKLIEQHLKAGIGVLFLIDIDNFKAVNDSMGHGMGDEVLRSLSVKLKQIFRDKDIIGRIGGDEFMVYIPNALPVQTIIAKAQQVNTAFYNTFTDMDGKNHVISGSIGIYIVNEASCKFDDAYYKADVAMYQTKKSGKNGYTIYTGGTFSAYESDRE